MGFLAVLFITVIVAATDTAAFAARRLIGGPAASNPHLAQQDLEAGSAAASSPQRSLAPCSRCSSAYRRRRWP